MWLLCGLCDDCCCCCCCCCCYRWHLGCRCCCLMSVTMTMAPSHGRGQWVEQSQVDVMVGLMVGLIYPSHLLHRLSSSSSSSSSFSSSSCQAVQKAERGDWHWALIILMYIEWKRGRGGGLVTWLSDHATIALHVKGRVEHEWLLPLLLLLLLLLLLSWVKPSSLVTSVIACSRCGP